MKELLRIAFLGALLLSFGAVQAATVTHNLSVEVLSGPFTGTTGSGFFSYDDATLTNIGDEYLTSTSGSLTLELTVFGQTFYQSDDVDFSFYPELGLIDGAPTTLDYIVAESDVLVTTDILFPGVMDFGIYDLYWVNSSFFAELEVNTHVSSVPVPAAVWLLGSGLLGLFGLFGRKAQ